VRGGWLRGAVAVIAALLTMLARPAGAAAAPADCLTFADPTTGNSVSFSPSDRALVFATADGVVFRREAHSSRFVPGYLTFKFHRSPELLLLVRAHPRRGQVTAQAIVRPATRGGGAQAWQSYRVSVDDGQGVPCDPPSPSPTATSSPSPTPSPTPRPAGWTPSPTGSPTPSPTVTSTPTATPSPSPTVVPGAPAISPTLLRLSTTFNSIGGELLFEGDPDGDATATLEFKKASETTWRAGLPLWRTGATAAPGPAFYGSALFLEAGTAYDVRVTVADPDGVTGQAVLTGLAITRSEDLAPAASLLATHHVRADGDDADDGATTATAWRTLERAIASAPSGAVVRVGPGYYAAPASARDTPLTLVAEHRAVDDAGAPVNVGRRSVIESGVVSGPAGASEPRLVHAPWERMTLVGPGGGGATAGASYPVWRWRGVPLTPGWLGHAATREGQPRRIAKWEVKGPDLQTPAGWAEKVYTNRTHNYGWVIYPAGGGAYDVYARFPGDLDPNTLYVTVGGSSGLIVAGPDVRLSGFELRPSSSGVYFSPAAQRGVVDHNLIVVGFAGVRLDGDKNVTPHRYGADHLIERNVIVDSSLWTDDHVAAPAVPWCFIKCSVVQGDGSIYPPDRIGEGNESTGVWSRGGAKRVVVRRNTIDGPFNGVAAYNSGFDRYAAQDQDIHDNVVRRIADDVFEPEQVAINWRIWRNRAEHSPVLLSTGPVAFGPLYLVRNEAWRIGKQGVGRADPAVPAPMAPTFFKYSGQSNPAARLFVLHNTFWTDSTVVVGIETVGVDGAGQYAGGGSSGERFYMRNNILRTTRYAFQVGAWDEDANSFTTSDAGRGLSAESNRWTSDVAAYRVAYAAAHGQTTRTNVGGDFVTPSDTRLSNPAAGDLTLAAGSPFVDGGVVVPNVSDRPGVDYAGGAPDLGATETSLVAPAVAVVRASGQGVPPRSTPPRVTPPRVTVPRITRPRISLPAVVATRVVSTRVVAPRAVPTRVVPPRATPAPSATPTPIRVQARPDGAWRLLGTPAAPGQSISTRSQSAVNPHLTPHP
jgi:hypothetical protein